jgi:hypothetical protein
MSWSWREDERTRGVLNLGHPLLTTTLAQQDSSGRGMRKNVSADWLSSVRTSKKCTCSGIALDLIGL